MNHWIQDLKCIDTLKNHKSNLNLVLEAFLTSDYAHCYRKRTEIITLFKHLQTLE